MPRKYAVSMSRAQDCFTTCTWHAEASTYILWSLIAQYVIGVKKKIPKEVIVRSLTDSRNPLKNPSAATAAWIAVVRVD